MFYLELILHPLIHGPLKLSFSLGFVKKPSNELPSTIQRESVIEQSRISAESWNFNVNDR